MQSDRMLSYQFIAAHPTDAARILERLSIGDAATLLQEAAPEVAAGVLTLMAPPSASGCLEGMELAPCSAIVTHLPVDSAVLLLRRMAADKRAAILDALPRERAAALHRVLRYPEATAGALMNPYLCTVPDDMLVQEAIEHLRSHQEHVADTIYVLNRTHQLLGSVSLSQLLFARPDDRVASIMQRVVGSLPPTTTHQGIIVNPLWQDFTMLAVVDDHGVFLGALDYRTVRRLERRTADRLLANRQLDAGTALGELYWIGLSALVWGMFSAGNHAMDELEG